METFSASLAFVRGIRRGPHKGQWRWALMFSLICVWINGWVNKRETGDLRRHRVHYDVILMERLDAVPVIARLVLWWPRFIFMSQTTIFIVALSIAFGSDAWYGNNFIAVRRQQSIKRDKLFGISKYANCKYYVCKIIRWLNFGKS